MKSMRSHNRASGEPQQAWKLTRRPIVASFAVVAVLVAAVALAGLNHASGPQKPRYILTANVNFSATPAIYTGPVSSDPTVGCSGSATNLYPLNPGATQCLRYKVTNTLNVGISVTSLSISNVTFTPDPTNKSLPSCQVADLDVSKSAFAPTSSAGYLSVGQNGGVAYVGEPITLKNDGNQNNCEKGTFGFTVTGSAQYTANTQTVLAASPSPATSGQPVALSATVTATTPVQAPPSTTPSGTVNFYECTNSACTSTPLNIGSAALNGSGVATISYRFYPSSATSYNLYALYAPTASTAPDWSGSQSTPPTSLNVGYTTTISGNQGGGLTIPSGQTFDVTSGGKVNGNVTIQSGGGLVVTGGTVNGGITSTGSVWLNLCGASISGGLSVTGSTGPVVIGNPAAGCPINTIKGGLTLTNNAGGVTVAGNNISGGLTCTGNNPQPTDAAKSNTVSGTRSGQTCAAGSF
jgi:hypothetical protein